METVIDQHQEAALNTHRPHQKTFKRPLEPIDRISEIWFGLIMVLTFTCSISVTHAGLQEVDTMLIAAIAAIWRGESLTPSCTCWVVSWNKGTGSLL